MAWVVFIYISAVVVINIIILCSDSTTTGSVLPHILNSTKHFLLYSSSPTTKSVLPYIIPTTQFLLLLLLLLLLPYSDSPAAESVLSYILSTNDRSPPKPATKNISTYTRNTSKSAVLVP